MYLDFSIRWEAILQYDALTTEPFQSQQTQLLNAICDFGHKTDLQYFSKTVKCFKSNFTESFTFPMHV